MPKQPMKVEVNSFVKGFISEASPLNFPPNCSLDEKNFELRRDGTRKRRLGFDLEVGHQFISAPTTTLSLLGFVSSTYKWSEPGGSEGDVFLAYQIDNKIFFFDMKKTVLSVDGVLGSVTLTGFPTGVEYSMASVDGKLAIAAGVSNIAVVSYDGTSFSVSYDTLKTRDVWGMQDDAPYEADSKYRGNSFNAYHIYNLQNQSWGVPRKDSAGVLKDPVTIYKDALTVYPSNSETVWPGLQFQPVTSGTPFERIYPDLYTDVLNADSLAPKGYFIIDVVNRGTSRQSAVDANKTRYPEITSYSLVIRPDYTESGCSQLTEFSGRIFYAGFNGKTISGDSRSPILSNHVFFSQLIKGPADFFKCYQEGDPTSRENSDVVDTDGGFIRIAGADRILRLVNVANALIVIATNGVWSITGGSDDGFKATNYRVDKVSTSGCISSRSVVADKDNVFYWSEEGINVITRNQLGAFQADSITDQTIKSFYQEIDINDRKLSKGAFDNLENKVKWVYKQGSDNYELILDLTLKAFSLYVINPLEASDVTIVDVFSSTPFQSVAINDSVYVATDMVMASTDEVLVPSEETGSSLIAVKYVVASTVGGVVKFSFASYRNTEFRDWQRINGSGNDAKAYMLTGAQTANDSSLQKQVQYLVMHFKRTEDGFTSPYVPRNPSSCFGQVRWDFSNTASSLKWSALKQMYRYSKNYEYSGPSDPYDTGFEVITTKNLIRGRGRALALYVETEPYKDCHLLGWSIAVDGNPRV